VGLDKMAAKGVLYEGLRVMGDGSILGGLMLGAIAVFVIDRQLTKAATFAAVGAGMTFFGFMHGEAIGIGQSPVVAASYLAVAGALYGCAKFAVVAPREVALSELHTATEAAE
jgi:AGZA family xanthine/uracil permease-like MFS transporter